MAKSWGGVEVGFVNGSRETRRAEGRCCHAPVRLCVCSEAVSFLCPAFKSHCWSGFHQTLQIKQMMIPERSLSRYFTAHWILHLRACSLGPRNGLLPGKTRAACNEVGGKHAIFMSDTRPNLDLTFSESASICCALEVPLLIQMSILSSVEYLR